MTRISGKTPATARQAEAKPAQATQPGQAVNPTAVEVKAVVSAPRPAAAGLSPLRVALDTALASRGLTSTMARKNLQGGLEGARLHKTAPLIEESARQALLALPTRAVGSGASLVAQAMRVAGGTEGIAILVDALERRGAGVHGAEVLLDDVRAAALAHLGALSTGADRKTALAAIVATDAALGATREPGSTYLSADYFNNEPGLKDLLAKERPRGGAVTGVGGALLDIAVAHKSDLVVSVDVSPAIRPFMQTVAAVLLAVDEACASRGLSDDERLELVKSHLGFDAGTARPLDDTLQALAALGLDTDAGARDVLTHLRSGRFGIGGNRPENASWLTAEGVAHLSGLARRGRIVAVTMDLASPEVPTRVNALMQAHGTKLGAAHLSNALDYITALHEVRANLSALDKKDGARLTTTAIEMGHPISKELGTQREPRAHDLATTLKGDGLLSRVIDARWGTPETAAGFWARATSERFGSAVPTESLPRSHADMMAQVDALEARMFATPESAKKAFAHLLQSKRVLEPLLRAAVGAHAIKGASPEKLIALAEAHLELPAPKNGKESQQLVASFTRSAWTPERKQALLLELWIAGGLPPSAAAPLLPRLDACPTNREVESLLWGKEGTAIKEAAQKRGVQLITDYAVEVFGLPRKDADPRIFKKEIDSLVGYRVEFIIESARDLCTHAGHLLSFDSAADGRESLVRMLSLALKADRNQYLLYECVKPPEGRWTRRDEEEVVEVARASASFPAPTSWAEAKALLPGLIASLEKARSP